MSSLDAACLVYASLAVPLVAAATWSLYRHSAPLWFDLLDADEMVVAAIHRLCTAGYVLLCAWIAVAAAPSAEDVRRGAVSAVLSALAALLALLAATHLVLVWLYVRARNRRSARAFAAPRWYAGPVQIPGATPPIVPLPPMTLPQPVFAPPHAGAPSSAPPPPFFGPPTGVPVVPSAGPPYPPPWCAPVPDQPDAWAPPRR